MKLKIKNYKHLKIKNYFKNYKFFLIYNGTSSKSFALKNQKLQKLNLTSYKISNNIAKKVLNRSIYKNFKPIINSLVIFLKSRNNYSNNTFNQLQEIDNSFKLVGLKINNKIYIKSFLSIILKKFNYNETVLTLLILLKTCLKIPFRINT